MGLIMDHPTRGKAECDIKVVEKSTSMINKYPKVNYVHTKQIVGFIFV